MSKLSVISGVTGQDGSYLAEYLLGKGERVVGFSRRTAVHSTKRIDHLISDPNFTYLEGDVDDQQFVWSLIAKYKPDKFFNLAAQSHVHTSFTNPASTFNIDTIGVLNILEAIRTLSPNTKFYQASTSEMFGDMYSEWTDYDLYTTTEHGRIGDRPSNDYPEDVWEDFHYRPFQNETTPFNPNSPYAIAKLAAHHLVRLYRESYGLKCCAGILFNHESPRRGDNFVTQKIIKWIVGLTKWQLQAGSTQPLIYEDDYIQHPSSKSKYQKLRLGNLDASRDWGHAKDYVVAMDMMLESESCNDYIVATGETHTIREFLTEAFSLIGISDWIPYVVIDPKFMRPSEVPFLRGDSSLIRQELGWIPKTTFKELVKDMYDSAQL